MVNLQNLPSELETQMDSPFSFLTASFLGPESIVDKTFLAYGKGCPIPCQE